ncbi:chain-length determining protein [Yersinia similis]|uniref:O-antigen chain length determinant n=3 Tax=Yersinia pseudotuberculosis complex TaxID=1649845 RepID=G4WJE0_YERPU|nr:LPS O-antigen length regulator Wzz(fepE) [Yersinia similis]AEP25502.1 O-antigen chain length determinant [Yersinia pseudotuberculosis]AHK20219.1 chain-length determining protein [Yersinia similis]CFQ69201.1 LPS O-antigen length regulator [Yersinia similis]
MSNKQTRSDLDTPIPNKYGFSNIPPSRNEVNLFQIFFIIFSSKLKVMFITLIFIISGLIVSCILPQQWTSTAIIVPPGDEQIQVLDALISNLTVLDIKVDVSANYLLSTFKQNFDSQNIREQYLVNTNYFKRLMKDNPEDGLDKRALIERIVNENISSVSPLRDNSEGDNEYRYYKLSYSASTPIDARDLLQGYVNYVNTIVNADVFRKVQRAVDLAKGIGTDKYSMELLRARNNQKVKIERLRYASSIADAAGVKKPVYSSGSSISDDPDFPITMGSDALNRKLEIEKSVIDLASINTELLNRKLYLDKLNRLEIPNVNIVPFKYLQQPTEPTKKDTPKRALIMILFALAGIVSSIGFVLVEHFLRERMQEEEELKLPQTKV